jgi:hypothetical protein
LADYVIECLLKGRLLEKHPWLDGLKRDDPRIKDKTKRRLLGLCYSHNLGLLLAELPGVEKSVESQGGMSGLVALKSVCSTWTIFARYSPTQGDSRYAASFVQDIQRLSRWLAG